MLTTHMITKHCIMMESTFFRLTSPTVIAKLRESFPELPEKPDQRTVFLKLRELRNSW